MTKHFVLVTYDIPTDRRRTKLHKRLQDYGTAVQYSVFECLLDDKDLRQMKVVVGRIIKPRVDNVRYYHLCHACQGRIETTSAGKEVIQEQDAYIV
ncbi:MAG: CRISPR-associated endonuclease Cas2 [Chloroflexi bacterium]|nr:CRISPR-associated endonuclease Cas2 [Chloroflexota bacterium]